MSRKTALTIRDVALLQELVERRAESLSYLEARYFRGVRKTARNRLRRLEVGGYVTRKDVETIEHPGRLGSVYTLGPAARAALRLRSPYAAEAWLGRRFSATLPDSSMPHQIATNRVGDWLGARLLPEHLLPVHKPNAQRHRPDGVYRCAAPDGMGRRLVFLEVDLGHYSRQRILGKIDAFLDHPDARSILFVSQTERRSAITAQWIREQYGEAIMGRVQPLTFEQICEGGWLDPGTEPAQGPDADALAA
jgi:protein involved in plasmid replication-relaxation